MEKISACLVTGGAGAIGSTLVRRLLSSGAPRVIVIDNLTSGYRWLLPEDERLVFINDDIAGLSSEKLALKDAFVFHLAAFFANQNSVDHPEDDLHTNGLGTLRVLKWAAENKSRRVIYSSAGCSIAGHGIDGPIREDMPVSLHLDTPYQITKALGEFYCNYYQNLVSTARCRFFNSYGPGEVPGFYRNVIPNFIWLALNNRPLTITGTGEETRDFIYVDDLIDGIILAATVPEAGGRAFNLGTGVQTRIGDLAETVIRLTGSKSAIVYGKRRAWDKSTHRQADMSLASGALNFKPTVKVEVGLGRTIEWFRRNFDRIKESVKEG
ncbi:MAG: NAD-dependent epimerase/dehydratase family protein [Deltaproteobacteria bacterium]|nr:NAD-dependent epimerase/dehydratase family protein [Deltaproteobacteria bacterium]